jgi:ubiquinone/menaquinone biosynthesis C-methylase UbiE
MLTRLDHSLKTEIDPVFAERAKIILNEAIKGKPARVLDAGCGRGYYIHILSGFDFIKVLEGIDLNARYLSIIKKSNLPKKVKVQKASLFSLSFKDNYFDFVVCSEVLEHVRDDVKALKELHRVLKPNGKLVITVPHSDFPLFWDPVNFLLMHLFNTHVNKNMWWAAGIWADHERLYSENELYKKVSTSGFKVIKTERLIYGCWPFSHFLLYGIGKNIVEKLGVEEFNRFSYKDKPFSGLLAKIFRLPDSFIKRRKGNRFVGLAMVLKKK